MDTFSPKFLKNFLRMEFSLPQRAQMVVKWLASERGVNQRDIGVLLGYTSNTSFSQVLNDKKVFPKTLPERLAALDPRINIDFLTGISDEMLVGETQPSDNSGQLKQQPIPTPRVGIFVPPELAQMVTDLTSIVRDQQAMIRNLVEKWCEKEKL